MRSRIGRVLLVTLVTAPVAGAALRPPPLVAQRLDDREESRLLRQAAALEGRGERREAERLLLGMLERAPTSSGALLALERVLRAEGRLERVLPAADRYLEREPAGSGIRHLKLRVLVELDSLAGAEEETERWIAAAPGSAEPYREGARIYEAAFGPERALALLRRGQSALDDPTSLALEAGDLLARTDRPGEAVQEWSRAIGEAGQGVEGVLRRIRERPGDAARLARPLVASLDGDPTTVDRRRAGVRIAVEVGLETAAVELAGRVLSGLTLEARRGFLAELVRQAEDRGAHEVALWAYRTLRSRATDPAEARALDGGIARAALAVGDTARSRDARERIVQALPAGSPERMRAMEELIRTEAVGGDASALVERLETFRREFPGASTLDELTAVVAGALRARGRGDEATALLQGVEGPRSALERGWLLLGESRMEEAVAVLETAVDGLEPVQATEVIQLLSLVQRLQPPSVGLVVRASLSARGGDPAGGVKAAADGLDGVPEVDRAAVLAHVARIADESGLVEDAARLRERIIADHPDAPERGEATLALARQRAAVPGGLPEALRLLEELIVERPDAAVVPAARRELERLRSRSTGGPQ